MQPIYYDGTRGEVTPLPTNATQAFKTIEEVLEDSQVACVSITRLIPRETWRRRGKKGGKIHKYFGRSK